MLSARVMIRTRLHWVLGRLTTGVLVSGLALLAGMNCAGPQPLHVAINPHDEQDYVVRLNEVNGEAASAYASWMATERGTTVAKILAADRHVGTTRNPFDAYRDPRAVSYGAVIYKIHCARCHGDDARGHGPFSLPGYPATDFKAFGNRFASTLHRGAPRKWFRVICGGSGDVVEYRDERTTAMPAFGDKMTREQIWLLITCLQSLDMHAREANDRKNRRRAR